MSAPSIEHEERIELLRSIATLSGYRCDIPVGNELVPDVARLSRVTRGLFVGDAKATETSGCTATGQRLRNYLRAVRAHHAPNHPLVLVVAHGDLHDQVGWVATVSRVLIRSGFNSPNTAGSLVIDEESVLAYAICRYDRRSVSDP